MRELSYQKKCIRACTTTVVSLSGDHPLVLGNGGLKREVVLKKWWSFIRRRYVLMQLNYGYIWVGVVLNMRWSL